MLYIILSLRNILRSRTRSFITLAAISFGCIALIFAGGFIEDSLKQLRESYIQARLGHIQIFKKGYWEKGTAHPFDYMIENPDAVLSLLRENNEVNWATPRLEFSGLLSTGETTVSFVGQGVDPTIEGRENSFLIIEKGKNLGPDDEFKAILGKGLAGSISANVGDSTILVANTREGSINALDSEVKGIFHTSSKPFDDRFLRVPLFVAQKLMRTDSIQTIVVLLKDTDKTAIVKDNLERLFKSEGFDLEMKAWYEMADFYTKLRKFYDSQFGILKFIIAIVGVLSVFNTLNMSVLERIGEVGTLRALGTKKFRVIILFMTEGFIFGLLGGILGVMGGFFVAWLVSSVGIPMPPPPGGNAVWTARVEIVPGVVCFAFFLALGTSLISSFFPAYKASKKEIADALRHNV